MLIYLNSYIHILTCIFISICIYVLNLPNQKHFNKFYYKADKTINAKRELIQPNKDYLKEKKPKVLVQNEVSRFYKGFNKSFKS